MQPVGIKKYTCLTLVFVMMAVPAFAADDDVAPAPDKSSYTLFNPVPDDLLRDFSSDRPTKGASPTTVDAGHFQYEADIANWTYDRYNFSQTKNSSFTIFDGVLKEGLTENSDFELVLSPFNFSHTEAVASGTKTNAYGFGDVTARIKYNLFGNEGGDYALALTPYIKAPTAEHDIGNGYWEGGLYAPFGATLIDGWTLGALTELDIQENADRRGMHTNYQNLVNLNHTLFSKDLTGSIEFWSDVNTDQDSPTQYSGDLALAWLVKDNLQLDSGVNIGLNKATPDAQLYVGISQRF